MNDTRIEFPCDYPIKVIGDAVPGFREQVVDIVREYDATMAQDKIKDRPSRNGNYQSITLLFWATGEQQLKDLFDALKQLDAVRMVL